MRSPQLLAILDGCAPAAVTEVVVSIRVIVRVGDDVVVCTSVSDRSHAWPGGRPEPGERYAETACREVHEETGWLLDPASLEPLGFLHIFNEGEHISDDEPMCIPFLEEIRARA